MVVNSCLEDLFDGHTQPLPVLETQTSNRTRGAQPGKKQALARINVPYPHDYRCIHDKVFYWLVESPGTLEEVGTGKRLGKRLWPQMTQAGVLGELRFAGQKAHTEATRVMKAQFQPRS